MTQDEILSAAKEVGITYYLTPKGTNDMHGTDEQIVNFARRIERIVERKTIERCAWDVYQKAEADLKATLAERNAEIARLSEINSALCRKSNGYLIANARLDEQVAEQRASIEKLKEAVKHWLDSSLAEPSLSLCIKHSEQILATPTSDVAIRKLGEE